MAESEKEKEKRKTFFLKKLKERKSVPDLSLSLSPASTLNDVTTSVIPTPLADLPSSSSTGKIEAMTRAHSPLRSGYLTATYHKDYASPNKSRSNFPSGEVTISGNETSSDYNTENLTNFSGMRSKPSSINGNYGPCHTVSSDTIGNMDNLSSYDIMNNQLSDMSAELTTKRIQIKNLTEEREQAVQQAKRGQQAISILVDEKTELTTQTQGLTNRIVVLEGQLSSTTEKLEIAEKRIAVCESELTGYTETLTRRQSNNGDGLELELAQLQKSLTEARLQLLDLGMANDEMQSKLQRQANEMEQLRQGSQSDVSCKEAQREIESLKGEIKELRMTATHAEEELDIALEREKGLVAQLNDSGSQIASLSLALQQVNQARDSVAEQHAEERAHLLAKIDVLSTPQPINSLVSTSTSTPLPDIPNNESLEKGEKEEELRMKREMERLAAEKTAVIDALKRQIEELEAEVADKAKLMTTVHSNAQTLSRLTLQNRTLKQQLEEVEDKFVDVIQKQMDTVTELQAAQYAADQWKKIAERQQNELVGEAPNHVEEDQLVNEKRQNDLAQQLMVVQGDRYRLLQQVQSLLAYQSSHPSGQPMVTMMKNAPIPIATQLTDDQQSMQSEDSSNDLFLQQSQPITPATLTLPSSIDDSGRLDKEGIVQETNQIVSKDGKKETD
eukprot:Ihof_evm1s349 gene=Ihof_evmTU1s349